MSRNKTIFISIAILLLAAVITAVVFLTEPTAKREGATKETAMLVNVTEVNRGSYTPVITATGTVQPSQDIMLSPRVAGEVINISSKFIPGGFVNKGEMIVQIDPADYKTALLLRQSDLRLAKADLTLEMGRQDVARSDYKLIGDTLSPEKEALVLREPQLESARAAIDAAEAAVRQAELNLQRTTVRAAFDAHVLERNVNIGSQVAVGENLGRIVGIDEYWVMVTLPVSKLRWLSFSERGSGKGSMVKIRNQTAWLEDEFRTGYLYKMVGTLEDQTRLARVLVAVPDPLAHNPKRQNLPALMIGSFVEASIEAKEIKDIIRLDRDYLRQNGTVWVMEEGELRIQKVNILLEDAEYAYISTGLKDGDKVVTTNLSTVVEGSRLRVEGEDTTTEQDTTRQNPSE